MNSNSAKGKTSRYFFSALAWLFAICVIVQVFLAGIAIFVNVGSWQAHSVFVRFFEFSPIVMLILAFTGKLPKWFRWHSLFLYLMILVQYATALLTSKIGILSAIHPIVALLLFWSSIVIAQRSTKYLNKNEKG